MEKKFLDKQGLMALSKELNSKFLSQDNEKKMLKEFQDDPNHRTVTDSEKEKWNNKVDKVADKQLSTNDYTNEDKTKVDAIPANPKYTDTTYDLSSYAKNIDIKTKLAEMTEDSTHRTVTDTEKSTWNTVLNKIDKVVGKDLSSNDFTDTDKTKLQNMPIPTFLEKEQYESLSEQEKTDSNKIYYIYAEQQK